MFFTAAQSKLYKFNYDIKLNIKKISIHGYINVETSEFIMLHGLIATDFIIHTIGSYYTILLICAGLNTYL